MYQSLLPTGVERRRRPRFGVALPVLRFEVPGVQLCLPLDDVDKVLPVAALEDVSDGPDYLLGMLDFGGEAVPTLDLGLRLGRPGFEYALDTPMLLCTHHGRRCALVVQLVCGVDQVDNGRLRRVDGVPHERRDPFSTSFDEGGHPVFMLDIESLCDGLQVDRLIAPRIDAEVAST